MVHMKVCRSLSSWQDIWAKHKKREKRCHLKATPLINFFDQVCMMSPMCSKCVKDDVAVDCPWTYQPTAAVVNLSPVCCDQPTLEEETKATGLEMTEA